MSGKMLKSIYSGGLILIFLVFSCGNPVRQKAIKSPEELFPGLFQDVQMSGIFTDSKVFADCVPKYPATLILEQYKKVRMDSNFSLMKFLEGYFEFPDTLNTKYIPQKAQTIEQYISTLWPALLRKPENDGGSLIPFRKPHVFSALNAREAYYQDAYFVMLGLAAEGKEKELENMVINFSTLINDFGHIPSGNRSYFLSRSHPPYFSLMVELLAEVKQDDQVLVTYLPALQKEYQYWMSSESKDETSEQSNAKTSGEKAFKKAIFIDEENVLNRYYDPIEHPRAEAWREDVLLAQGSDRDRKQLYRDIRSGAESGWNFSSRWLTDDSKPESIHTTEILPVDLNALLYHLESVLERASRLSGKQQWADSYKILKEKRKSIFDRYFWDEKNGFYTDYDFVADKQTGKFSLAGVFPLFFGLASEEQAEAVAEKLQKSFLKPGGLTAILSRNERDLDGAASLHWVTIHALRNYGHEELALEIKNNWINNCLTVYIQKGQLLDRYDVFRLTPGESYLLGGFGPTNGVLLKLLSETDKEKEEDQASSFQ
jgi:alpha,alpha-trehalase